MPSETANSERGMLQAAIAAAQRHQDALFVALLALVVWALGAHTLGRFWRGDDTPVLAHMIKYPLRDIFFTPAIWQELSTANLTPWISLSFRVDYALAGLDPRAFYLHHMVTLWLVAVVAYRLFMRVAVRWLAAVGTVLFLLGAPVQRVGEQLFTRHYLEGLLFCLLALHGFLRYRDSGRWPHQLLALTCYAVAMTAKEVYVPLGLLLVMLAHGDRRQRMKQVGPYLVLLGIYVLWRAWMLAGHVGGYAQGSVYVDPAFWSSVAASFAGMPGLMFGRFDIFVTASLLLIAALGLWLQPARIPLAMALAAFVFGPLVPLVAYPGITGADRYLLLPWLLLCFAFVAQAQVVILRAGARHPAWPQVLGAVLSLALALCLLDYRRLIAGSEASYQLAYDAQMRHVWTHDATTAFMPDATIAPGYGTVRALGEVKRLLDPDASIPVPLLDPLQFDTALPLYAYAAGCNCMRDVSNDIPRQRAEWQRRLRKAPLSLAIRNRDGWIDWEFGPYAVGAYNVISSHVGNLPLPANQPGLRTNIRRDIELTLRYTAPEGWVTYSPPLRLRSDGTVLAWARGLSPGQSHGKSRDELIYGSSNEPRHEAHQEEGRGE
ncbi:MAG TPA: hypothetical protein VGE69_09585 [Pseudomonadales bacterium]